MEYYTAMKKDEPIPSAATWKDLEMIVLNEVKVTEKDKYHVIIYMWGVYADKYHVIIYTWMFKYGICTVTQMNVFTKQKKSHSHTEETCGCQKGGGRRRRDG